VRFSGKLADLRELLPPQGNALASTSWRVRRGKTLLPALPNKGNPKSLPVIAYFSPARSRQFPLQLRMELGTFYCDC